jgi:hypothetical protein
MTVDKFAKNLIRQEPEERWRVRETQNRRLLFGEDSWVWEVEEEVGASGESGTK